MTDHAQNAPHPWRDLLRFSVRGMIVLVLVISVWLGWLVRSAQTSASAEAYVSSVRNRRLQLGVEQWRVHRRWCAGLASASGAVSWG